MIICYLHPINLNVETMNRTFHSKVDWWYWLLIIVTAFLLFDFFWFHYTLLTLLLSVIMIFEIEMLIHTCYIVTGDGKLKIETGRFIPNSTIELNSIVAIHETKGYSVAPALSASRVEIVYRLGEKNHTVQISPKNSSEFIRWIQKKTEQ